MYDRIIVGVDMTRTEEFDKAVHAAAELAKATDAEAWMVAITGKAKPHDGSHDHEAFQQKVDDFARQQGEAYGVTFRTRVVTTADAYSDVKKCLYEAIDGLEADLIVLASHEPGLKEYVLPSTSASMVKHARCSVLVVR